MRMDIRWTGLLLLVGAVVTAGVIGAADAAAPAAKPGNAATPAAEATEPSPETPLLSVGDQVITAGDLDEQLAEVPPMQREMYKPHLLKQMATQALAVAFASNRHLPIDEAKFQKEVQRLRASMALQKLFRDATSDEKVAAYIKAHPSFFDGTKVAASHILIASAVTDSTEKQLAAKTKLEGIAKEIAAGKISFADAAKKHSEDPGSGANGGALGQFEFGGPMVPVFTLAAFQTPKGKVSPLVRSTFGWHIIQVTDITPGDGKPKNWTDPRSQRPMTPEQLAQRMIGSTIENQINLTALDAKTKIVNHMADEGDKPGK